MKNLRVTYNYHSMLQLNKFTQTEISLTAGDSEAEDCFQEFNAYSHSIICRKESNFPMLKLLALICTAQIFLAGDVIAANERENICGIVDVEVLE